MVVIRNVFRLKFGKAREAVALFKEGMAIQKRVGRDFFHAMAHGRDGPLLHGRPGNHSTQSGRFRGRRAPADGRQRLAGELSEDRGAGGFRVSRSLYARRVSALRPAADGRHGRRRLTVTLASSPVLSQLIRLRHIA